MLLFVGTYTRKTASEGVYAWHVGPSCAGFEQFAVNADIENPSWLVRHPRLPVLYAVNEISDRDGGGMVAAFAYDESGRLSLLSEVNSMGADPCHLAIDAAGTTLMVSNYSGGSLATFSIDGAGALGDLVSFVQHAGHSVDPVRQKSAHVHSITLVEDGRFAYVADLGVDRIYAYPVVRGHLDVNQRTSLRLKPGAGPRHCCFAPGEEIAFLINELDSTIVSMGRDNEGALIELSTISTLPAGSDEANYCAHIAVSDDGRFLYATNRGHDSIAVFEVGREGQLSPVQFLESGGQHPRHFSLTPDNDHVIVANRDSNNLVVFERSETDGTLTATGTEVSVPAPVCVLFA